MMKIEYIDITADFVSELPKLDRARVSRVVEYFEKYGFRIGPKYVKKVSGLGIWELRAGKVRLFLYEKGGSIICLHAIYKKSQKLKRSDIRLVERRSKEV